MAELDVLEEARRQLRLTVGDLWLRYFALGGMSTSMEVEAILYGALVAPARDRDLLSVALNERCAELGGDHPLPYSDDDPDRTPDPYVPGGGGRESNPPDGGHPSHPL